MENAVRRSNIITVLTFFLLTLFPLAFDNFYYNITTVKYRVFAVLALGIFYSGIYFTLRRIITNHFSKKAKPPPVFGRHLTGSDLCLVMLLAVSTISCLCSRWRLASFSGSAGTYTGLIFLLMAAGMYYGVSQYFVMKPLIRYSFPIILILLSVMSVVQCCGYDIMGFLEDIDITWKEYYIATLGHINVYASFVCIYLSVCLYLFCRLKGKSIVLYGIAVFSGFISALASNSDSCYLGIGAAMLILFLISIRGTSMTLRYGVCLMLLSASLGCWHLLERIFHEMFREQSGINQLFCSPPVIAGILLLGILLLLFGFFARRKEKVFSPIASRVFIIISAVCILLLIICILWFSIVDRETPLGSLETYLRFSKEWGNSRGYPWTWTYDFFVSGSWFHKLFGTGPDTSGLMFVLYHGRDLENQMYFVSAHNIYLDYLLTVGLFGLVAYVGVIVTSILRCINKRKESDFYGATALAIVSYAVISVVTISQPNTVPLFFLMIAFANCNRL